MTKVKIAASVATTKIGARSVVTGATAIGTPIIGLLEHRLNLILITHKLRYFGTQFDRSVTGYTNG
jgi:hypothetical protein